MKVRNIVIESPLAVIPIGDRLYKSATDNRIEVVTDEGTFRFDFRKYFTSNYRSGGAFVDQFIDQVVSEKVGPIWWFHDLCYTPCAALDGEHPVSRKLADELLRCLAYAAEVFDVYLHGVFAFLAQNRHKNGKQFWPVTKKWYFCGLFGKTPPNLRWGKSKILAFRDSELTRQTKKKQNKKQ